MVSGGFRLDLLLETAHLARSTYYYHLKQLDQPDKNQELKAEIQSIYSEHKGNYGYRRVTLELRNRGFVVNHKKVQRLMKVLGLVARIRRKRKYSSYQGDTVRAHARRRLSDRHLQPKDRCTPSSCLRLRCGRWLSPLPGQSNSNIFQTLCLEYLLVSDR